ncbi:MAG: HypC/HybG/HupF family hydrogenase formation chaperone [Kiritimatiellia bacterium]
MCLAVPMRIVEIRPDGSAVAELDGVRRAVELSLVENAPVGCYVIVHAGYAIEVLDEQEANERIAFFAELVRSENNSKIVSSP